MGDKNNNIERIKKLIKKANETCDKIEDIERIYSICSPKYKISNKKPGVKHEKQTS